MRFVSTTVIWLLTVLLAVAPRSYCAPLKPQPPSSAPGRKPAEMAQFQVPQGLVLGKLFWLKPGEIPDWTRKYQEPNTPPWIPAGIARGTVRYPKSSALFLEVGYDAAHDPSLITRYGPDLFAALRFHNVDTDDRSVAKLAALTGLKALGLSESDMTDASMKAIGKLKSLVSLTAGQTTVTAHCLADLKDLHELRHLNLDATEMSDGPFNDISALPQLQTLNVKHCQLADSHVQSISSLTNLVELGLEDNKAITAKGLLRLANLKHLRSLDIQETGVTPADLATIKQLVEQLPALKILAVREKTFSEAQIKQWKQALPHSVRVCVAGGNKIKGGVDPGDIPALFAPLHSWSDERKQKRR